MQLDAVAVHNAVQRAAVDVRQLEHGVLLALEQEAALHLAVKQRIDLADAQAVAELEILGRRHRLEHLKLRARRLCQPDGALRLIRQDGKLPSRRQADRLIEIKIRRLPFPAHGKHRHAQLEIQIDRSGTLAVKAQALRREILHGLLPLRSGRKAAVRQAVAQHAAVAGKGQLVQIFNQGGPPPPVPPAVIRTARADRYRPHAWRPRTPARRQDPRDRSRRASSRPCGERAP